MTDLIEDIRN